MKKQKVINVTWQDGAYYNFFNSPESIDSLARLISEGWILIFIKDDKEHEKVVAVFEREG